MSDSGFTPDAATLRWLIEQLISAAEYHHRISELAARGTDRAIRKATAASSLALAQYLDYVAGLVEAGNWPPGEGNETSARTAKSVEASCLDS